MGVDQASDLIRETLLLALIISAPLLIVGLVVGLIVSLLQAVTQIQEQTLVFVPKIAAMIAAAIFVMPWLSMKLMDFAAVMFGGSFAP
jgi:flagellar biosynthetic protein FliQ